jgi:hypothetical protein
MKHGEVTPAYLVRKWFIEIGFEDVDRDFLERLLPGSVRMVDRDAGVYLRSDALDLIDDKDEAERCADKLVRQLSGLAGTLAACGPVRHLRL